MNNFNLTLNETIFLTTTEEEYVYIGIRVFEKNDNLLGMILSIYYITYIISMFICSVSIFIYYLPNKEILFSIKLSSIICIISYGIGNTAWTLNVNCSLVTASWLLANESKDTCYTISQFIALYAMGFGYCFFFCSFWLRLINSFKDSMFEISDKKQKWMKIFVWISMTTMLVSLLLKIIYDLSNKKYIYFFVFSLILLIVDMVGYIGASVTIVKLMFTKIRQFTQFVTDRDNINIEINDSNPIEREAHQLIELLTRLYTVALVSSTIVLFINIICVIVIVSISRDDMDRRQGQSIWRTNLGTYMFFSFFPLLLIIDSIINCLCLLLQINNAKHLYPKLCFCCDKFSCLKMN